MATEVQCYDGDGVAPRESDWTRVSALLDKIENTPFAKGGPPVSVFAQFNQLVLAVRAALNGDRSAKFGSQVITAIGELDQYLVHNVNKLYSTDNHVAFKVSTWAHQSWQIAVEHDKRIGIG